MPSLPSLCCVSFAPVVYHDFDLPRCSLRYRTLESPPIKLDCSIINHASVLGESTPSRGQRCKAFARRFWQ